MVGKYIKLATQRIEHEIAGTLKTRPMNKPIYDPEEAGNSLRIAPWSKKSDDKQLRFLEKRVRYSAK